MASATPKAPDVDPFFFADRGGPGPHGPVPRGPVPRGEVPPAATTLRPVASGRARTAPATGPAAPAGKRRRQWGGDRRTRALPMVPEPVSERRVAMARLAIIVTVTAWLGYVITWFFDDFFHPGYESAVDRAESVLYLLIVSLLTVSALAYLLSRLGFFYRTRTHHRASRAILDQFFDTNTPTLTTIVPSYQEDGRVIRNTLLSAALQEYPNKRVVLLIDDPFVPKNAKAREQLEAARALPGEMTRLLSGPVSRFTRALQLFEASCARREPLGLGSMIALASSYEEAASWLEQLAGGLEIIDHTDAFFANEVVLRLAASLRAIGSALLASADEGVILEQQMFRRLYRRLVWTFRAEITSFERKRYASLSHEPNKAMNLNSYMGLMGGCYREVRTVTGPALVRSQPGPGTLNIPDPDYVVTLDADSVLLPEYCLRLVHLLEQNEYRDMAIAQTPYSSFPGSSTRLERIAAASTDLQHIVHQGLTYYDATFWVGANAVIRKRALNEIAETSYIGDWEIRHFIRDRTVIEDTESTIDMGIHGWRLYNCPERLSYSATPPDFGSLCIQRRRWANGGLLIIPKLRRQSRARRALGQRTGFGELFLRWNYMASISWSSISLLVLLAFPFSATLISPLLGLVALPYFLAMASDLRYCGYKRLDVLRIYGFNLVLLPVNLAGTLSSVVQGITASKAPFARTPKVRNRTVVGPFFVIAPYLLIVLAGGTFYFAYRNDRVENMAYAALNVVLACYAAKAFIGLRNSVVDVCIHATSLLYKSTRRRRVPRKIRRAQQQAPQPTDWRSVLEVGFVEPQPAPTGTARSNTARSNTARSNTARSAQPWPDQPRPVPPTSGQPAAGPPGKKRGPAHGAAESAGESRRRLSLLRVLVALIVLGAAGYGGLVGVQTRLAGTAVVHQTWFAPYVDVTLTPTYQFQSSTADLARQTVLGFVVAEPGTGCTPSWGAAYPLAQANQSLTLSSRIAQLEQDGAQPIVSFGGQAHTSLDVGCTSVTGLARAYQSVINSYQLTAIDLDIEGAALNNFAAEQRRAAAVADLEQAARAAHRQLSVWLTLPVEPSGLQGNAISVISSMLQDHVSITGINVMTMDFTHAPAAGSTMLTSVESALNATHAQLADLFPRYGIRLRSQQIWQRLGATVMIGQNDIAGENFTVPDARGLVGFAGSTHLGRISMWSLNRDSQCGSSFPETGLLSNTCSGTAQSSLEFSQVFGHLHGVPSVTVSAGNVQPAVANTNPADAPYPQWSATANYPYQYKVVEDGEIYQAKWFNSGDDPQAQVQYAWQTPWELLGPVLPGDHAPVITPPSPGTYPAWSISTQYQGGDKVLYQGLPYQSKWDNQGVSPQGATTDPVDSPWKALYKVPGEPAGTSVQAPSVPASAASSSPSAASSSSPSAGSPTP
jgi:cellulose synthase/poly-beta-1,6-N-acetylglucosamine synthase-like glycosyltransferase/chitodextrinase